jgi:hypothetical protein
MRLPRFPGFQGRRAGARLAAVFLLILAAAGCRDPQQTVVSSSDQARGDSAGAGKEGVEGRVISEDGKPMAELLVQAASLDQPSKPIPELGVLTGEDGRYFWPLSPGRYRISVAAEGYQPASGDATVEPGRRATLNLTLRRSR